MHLCSEQEILSAVSPKQIYSMNPATLDQEYETYCQTYRKGQKFRELTNFVVLQQITYLYKRAQEMLAGSNPAQDLEKDVGSLSFTLDNAPPFRFSYTHHINQGVCDTYSNDRSIILVIDEEMENRYGFYTNFVYKVNSLSRFWERKSEKDFENFKYSIPDIQNCFHSRTDKKYVIYLKKPSDPGKPCRIYPLRDVLNYFDGRLSIDHVVSIIKRLYSIACRVDIAKMNHNGITLDSIYFSPGRFILPDEKYTVEDMRIVGLYGGWFFTTYKDEKVCGFPAALSDIIPTYVKSSRHSSYEVDMLAIKKVARELLGDVTGANLYGVNSKLVDWFNKTTCEKNAYEEYAEFESICEQVFGKPMFHEMDISL